MKTFVALSRWFVVVILLAGLSFAQVVSQRETTKPSPDRITSKRKPGRPKLNSWPVRRRVVRPVRPSLEQTASAQTVVSPEGDPGNTTPNTTNSGEESPKPAMPEKSATTEPAVNRMELEYTTAPALEVELAQYVTSDTGKPKSFRLTGTLVQPLQSENGEVIVPAQTRVTINAHVKPGKRLGKPGEIIFSLEPIMLQELREAGQREEAGEADGKSALQQHLGQSRWLVIFSHKLDYAATPEEKAPLILSVGSKSEGLIGRRGTRPPQNNFDSTTEMLDTRMQTATGLNLVTGAIYTVTTATVGSIRWLFSKRNLFLPVGSRLYFQLEKTVHLKRLSEEPGSMKLYREEESSEKAVPQNKPINPK